MISGNNPVDPYLFLKESNVYSNEIINNSIDASSIQHQDQNDGENQYLLNATLSTAATTSQNNSGYDRSKSNNDKNKIKKRITKPNIEHIKTILSIQQHLADFASEVRK